MTLHASETAHGTGFALDGFDNLICAAHGGGLEFSGRTPSGDRVECRRDDCNTRAIVR